MTDALPTPTAVFLAIAVAFAALAMFAARRIKPASTPAPRYSADTKAGRLNNARTAIKIAKEDLDAADELIASVVREFAEGGE